MQRTSVKSYKLPLKIKEDEIWYCTFTMVLENGNVLVGTLSQDLFLVGNDSLKGSICLESIGICGIQKKN